MQLSRTEIINTIINKYNFKSYLEIGLGDGGNFKAVNCDRKVSVDPNGAEYAMTSDQFFEHTDNKFDLIFIDGLHEAEYVYKDIVNSMSHLNKGGVIVCHDMLPSTEAMQRVPRIQDEWTGDCWKAFVKFKDMGYSMVTINTDYGCAIIRDIKKVSVKCTEPLTWEYFKANRDKLMNVKSPEWFIKTFK